MLNTHQLCIGNLYCEPILWSQTPLWHLIHLQQQWNDITNEQWTNKSNPIEWDFNNGAVGQSSVTSWEQFHQWRQSRVSWRHHVSSVCLVPSNVLFFVFAIDSQYSIHFSFDKFCNVYVRKVNNSFEYRSNLIPIAWNSICVK